MIIFYITLFPFPVHGNGVCLWRLGADSNISMSAGKSWLYFFRMSKPMVVSVSETTLSVTVRKSCIIKCSGWNIYLMILLNSMSFLFARSLPIYPVLFLCSLTSSCAHWDCEMGSWKIAVMVHYWGSAPHLITKFNLSVLLGLKMFEQRAKLQLAFTVN